MTARMDGSFIDYVDFIDVVQEALETAPRKLFEKMMRLLLNKFHNQEIELQKLALEMDEMHSLPVDDLDEFYDTTLDAIENIKLFKKKLDQIKKKDILFEDLYIQADKLYTSLVIYMDRMGQLEVRILQENQKSA
ncbi:hypothetical protein [Sulfurovum sp.]|nr:hypothetical protein [Sulfurovum sp.]